MPTLVVRLEDGTETKYALEGRALRVGRSPACEVCIDRPAIGSFHCVLQPAASGWAIEPCGPSMTWIDGRPLLRSEALRVGQSVRIEGVTLQLHHDD
jgi:hypothetical protein